MGTIKKLTMEAVMNGDRFEAIKFGNEVYCYVNNNLVDIVIL